MADVSPSPSGKKALNLELNLVPFIDLLSTLVLFLLVTTVWLQISSVPVGLEKAKGSSETTAAAENPSKRLDIHLTPQAIRLRTAVTEVSLPESVADLESLKKILAPVASHFETSAVSAEESVEYGTVIAAIDTAKTAGIANVGLTAE